MNPAESIGISCRGISALAGPSAVATVPAPRVFCSEDQLLPEAVAANADASTITAFMDTLFGVAPDVPPTREPEARIFVDPPLAAPLSHGLVVIQYRAENLRFAPVYGPNAIARSPRIGHIQVTVDDSPWHWADTSGQPLILNSMRPGSHKVAIGLADANYQILDQEIINFVVPEYAEAHTRR